MRFKYKVSITVFILLFIGGTNAPFLVSEYLTPKIQKIYYRVFYPEAFAQSKVILQDGTRIAITLKDNLSSETSTVGQVVNFEVTRDVAVNGHTVINAGTPAYGEVTGITKKGSVGKAGAIALSVNYTKAIDGQNVPLRATLSKTGEDKLGTSVGLSLIVCPLFLLKKGGESEYPAGSQFEAFVNTPVEIQVQ